MGLEIQHRSKEEECSRGRKEEGKIERRKEERNGHRKVKAIREII